jgi:hypothetical protein
MDPEEDVPPDVDVPVELLAVLLPDPELAAFPEAVPPVEDAPWVPDTLADDAPADDEMVLLVEEPPAPVDDDAVVVEEMVLLVDAETEVDPPEESPPVLDEVPDDVPTSALELEAWTVPPDAESSDGAPRVHWPCAQRSSLEQSE